MNLKIFSALIIFFVFFAITALSVSAVVDSHGVTMGSNANIGNSLWGMSITTNHSIVIYNITVGGTTTAPNITIFSDDGGGAATFITSTDNVTDSVFYLVQNLNAGNYFIAVTNGTGNFDADYAAGSFPIDSGGNIVWNGRAYPLTYPGASGWSTDSFAAVIVSIGSEDALCSPLWICTRYSDCISGTLSCLNATDLATCGVPFNGTLSLYDLSCEDANRTTIFYDTFTGADNWTYLIGTHNFTDGLLEMQDLSPSSEGAYVNVVVGNGTIHAEVLVRYSENIGDFVGIIQSNLFPHINNFETFIMQSREINCQNGSIGLYASGFFLDLNTWYLFDVVYNPSSGFWNLSVNDLPICTNMGNLSNEPMQEVILGGGSSPAMWTANFDYMNISQDALLCNPSWSCSSFGACNISNVSACLNVTDGNSCGVEFNGSLSDYDENCSYVQPWSASVVNPTGGISLVVGDSFGGTIVRFYKNENLITSDMTLNAVYLNTTSVGFSGFYYEPYDSGWEWLFTVPAVSDGIYDYVVNATYVNSSNGSDIHEFLVMGYGALNITNPCVENWTCSGYGACVNLTQNCTAVIDENTCGTNYTGNYSEFPPQPCGGTSPSPSIIGLGILVFDLVLFLLISITDGMMLRKTPEANRAFRALYGLVGLIAIVAVLALLL